MGKTLVVTVRIPLEEGADEQQILNSLCVGDHTELDGIELFRPTENLEFALCGDQAEIVSSKIV